MNIFSGAVSIVLSFNGSLHWAAFFILFAAIFDFLDGMFARILKAYSDIGKELDSLADMISFGLAPSVIIFQLFRIVFGDTDLSMKLSTFTSQQLFFMFSSFLIVVFSGLRLAKFNIDTRQTTSFIGMPTPANALFIISFPLILYYNPDSFLNMLILNPYFLLIASVVLSLLLVSEIPMFSLKFKSLKFNENKIRYIFIFLSAVVFILLQIVGIPIIILSYILLSIINNIFFKTETK